MPLSDSTRPARPATGHEGVPASRAWTVSARAPCRIGAGSPYAARRHAFTTVPAKPSSITTLLTAAEDQHSTGSDRGVGYRTTADDHRPRCRLERSRRRAAEPQRRDCARSTVHGGRRVGYLDVAVRWTTLRRSGPRDVNLASRRGPCSRRRSSVDRLPLLVSSLSVHVAAEIDLGAAGRREPGPATMKRTPYSTTAPGSPTQSVTNRPPGPWCTCRGDHVRQARQPSARLSFQWIRLKSPDAPGVHDEVPADGEGLRGSSVPTSTSSCASVGHVSPAPGARGTIVKPGRRQTGSPSTVVMSWPSHRQLVCQPALTVGDARGERRQPVAGAWTDGV